MPAPMVSRSVQRGLRRQLASHSPGRSWGRVLQDTASRSGAFAVGRKPALAPDKRSSDIQTSTHPRVRRQSRVLAQLSARCSRHAFADKAAMLAPILAKERERGFTIPSSLENLGRTRALARVPHLSPQTSFRELRGGCHRGTRRQAAGEAAHVQWPDALPSGERPLSPSRKAPLPPSL
jgi:hypothetical protein